MTDYGFKVSQPGYDVKTATDTQLVASSKFNALKSQIIGVISLTIPANVSNLLYFNAPSINHNLLYVPAVFIMMTDGTTAVSSSNIGQQIGTPATYLEGVSFEYQITSTQLNIFLLTNNSSLFPGNVSFTMYFKYYIFTQKIG